MEKSCGPLEQILQGSYHRICPVYANLSVLGSCVSTLCENKTDLPTILKEANRPTPLETWGYGLLLVTGINLCSLLGAVVIPFSNKQFYRQILMFMVALAVGSLAASGLLFLIPDALGLNDVEELHGFHWKMTTVSGGVYLFFLVERILKLLMHFKKPAKEVEPRVRTVSQTHENDVLTWGKHHVPESHVMNFDHLLTERIACTIGDCPDHCTLPPPGSKLAVTLRQKALEAAAKPTGVASAATPIGDNDEDNDDDENQGFSQANSSSGAQLLPLATDNSESSPGSPAQRRRHTSAEIAPVAWMIICADGLHNFIDGLSIGVAFTRNLLTGFGISVAVLCEELPHELGDFAVLLQSGMSLRQALGYNFLSACICYVGLCLGILLGEFGSASHWIFAVAGGMFLYISLVDMLPEVNHAAEEDENLVSVQKAISVFVLQNFGIFVGYGVLLVMALYGGDIDFTTD